MQKFFWNTLGNVSNASVQLVVLLWLSHQHSVALAGLFALALAIVTPIFNFLGMQIRGVIASDVRGHFAFNQYLSAINVTAIIGWGLTLIALWVYHYDAPLVFMVMILAAVKYLENVADVYYGFFQQQDKLQFAGQSLLLKNALLLVSLPLLSQWHAMLWLYLLSRLASLWFDLWRLKALVATEGALQFMGVGKIVKLALPMGLVVAAVALINSVPRWVLEHYAGVTELAHFASVAAVVLVLTTLTNSLGQYYMRALSVSFAKGRFGEFIRMLMKQLVLMWTVALLMLFATILAAPSLCQGLFADYQASDELFLQLMMLVGLLQCSTFILGFAITAMRWFRSHAMLQILVLALTVPAQIICIAHWGLTGAALALAFVALLQLLGAMWLIAYGWYKTHFSHHASIKAWLVWQKQQTALE